MNITRRLALVGVAVGLALAGCSGGETTTGTNVPRGGGETAIQQAAGACGEAGQKYTSLKGKKINVGSNPGLNYYNFVDEKDPSKVIGLEPDLVAAISKCVGFTYGYQKMDFNGLIPALKANRIDLITSGMYATAERAKEVNFVSYMKAAEAAVVAKGNPKGITGLDKMCGTTVAQVVGTVEVEIAAKESKKCVSAGKPAIKFLNFTTNNQLISSLTQKRADVFLTDAGVAAYIVKQFPTLEKGFDIVSDFMFGIGVNKSNQDLFNAVYDTLAALHGSGDLAKLAEHWGFSGEQIIKPAKVS